MKNVLCSILAFILLCGVMVLGLKACDHEAEQTKLKTVNGYRMLKTVNLLPIKGSN